jgi:hypothetical protein
LLASGAVAAFSVFIVFLFLAAYRPRKTIHHSGQPGSKAESSEIIAWRF